MRVCVVGVGALGRHHARILSQLPGVSLVAVAEPNPASGQQVAEACGCRWTGDYRELLDQVDAASIVVPTSLHQRVAGDFLQAGVPVLIEKPLACNSQEGEWLVQLAAERGLALQVGHIERFNPAFRALAERCGEPKYIRAERMSPYPFRSTDIGVVFDLMIHDLELVLHLVGEDPARVEAFGVSVVGGHEDVVQARLSFPSGCIADLTAHRICPLTQRTLQVWSDRGCTLADLQSRQLQQFRAGAALQAGQLPFYLGQQPGADIPQLKAEMFERFLQKDEVSCPQIDALTAELASFAEAVRTGQTPEVDGHQGLRALRVAEAVLECVVQHQWDGHSNGRRGPQALLETHLPGTTGLQRSA
jgi:predicted dehydrogenase